MRVIELIVEAVSAEWLLRLRPNGGTAILIRSFWISAIIFGVYLSLENWLDPHRLWWTFSLHELHLQVSSSLHLIGPILAGVYAALYTRFASQWSYLASVYNQIKAAETRKDCNSEQLALWKAGFIEDAEELHLANKHHFASTIRAWGRERQVDAAFAENAPGGAERLAILLKKADEMYASHGQRYGKQGAQVETSPQPTDQPSPDVLSE
jgi:hypothetical protein